MQASYGSLLAALAQRLQANLYSRVAQRLKGIVDPTRSKVFANIIY